MVRVRGVLLSAGGGIVGLTLLRFVPGSRPADPVRFELIAHRGVHQTFENANVGRDGCTAAHLERILQPLIENTIPSIAAAFEHGATRVEIDIHETADDQMVVFHDWTVDCRTDGHGVTREQTLAYLKALDVGWGYTADGGKTFPLRGTGVGMMPMLSEVLNRFPRGEFILHQKSSSRHTVEVLETVLARYPSDQLARLHYWGSLPSLARELIPDLGATLHDGPATKRCMIDYLESLGLGRLPSSCRGADLILPAWTTRGLWGWPNRFITKIHREGGRVFVWTDDLDSFIGVPIDRNVFALALRPFAHIRLPRSI